jgi:hypothetical protein
MNAQDRAKIAIELESLKELTVNQLREKWAEVWGEACRSRNKEFLRKRIAWKIQANAYGGLSERALARARELADETLLKIRNPAPVTQPSISSGARTIQKHLHAPGDPRIPPPGAVIAREYKGRKLLVAVLEKGFEFEGQVYRSLSAVAKEITGAHWNGLRFFGLEGRQSA